jgi:hypothetical protein
MMHLRPFAVADEDDPSMLGFEEFFGVVIPPDESPPLLLVPPPPQPPRGRLLPGEGGEDQAGGNARNRPRERTHPREPPFPGVEDGLDEETASGSSDGYGVVDGISDPTVNASSPQSDWQDQGSPNDGGSDSDVWEPAYPPTGSILEADELAADLVPAGDDVEVAAMNSRRLRGQMYNMGYRDGAAEGLAAQAQPGCDAGYQFGATIGRVTGWILGLLSVLASLAAAVADQTYRDLRAARGEEDSDTEYDYSDDAGGVELPGVNPEPRPLRGRPADQLPFVPRPDPGPSVYVDNEMPDMVPINTWRPTMTGVTPRNDYSDEELGFGPAAPPRRSSVCNSGAAAAGGPVLDEDALARAEALAAIRTRRSDLRRGCAPSADGSPTNCANARHFDGVALTVEDGAVGPEENTLLTTAPAPPPPLPPSAEELRAERLRGLLAAAREELTKERLWEPRLMELARATPEEGQQQLWEDVAAVHPVVVRWRGEVERAMREFALDTDGGLVAEDDGGNVDDDGHQVSEF